MIQQVITMQGVLFSLQHRLFYEAMNSLFQDWDMLAPSRSATSAQTRGGFDFVFILTVWTDAQCDVGADDKSGHHNETWVLITTDPGGQ